MELGSLVIKVCLFDEHQEGIKVAKCLTTVKGKLKAPLSPTVYLKVGGGSTRFKHFGLCSTDLGRKEGIVSSSLL